MGKYKPKRKLSAGEKKLFNLQKKSIITRGKSINSLDPDKLRDVGYTKKPESTIEKPPTLTGRVDQTKGSPAPKRTTFKPENQFNSYNPLDEEMRKYKTRKNPGNNPRKRKRIVGSAEKAIFDRQTKETTYDGSPKIRATNREIDKQKKLVDRYSKKYKTPKEKIADLQRSRLARRGEYMEDQYTPLHEDRKTFDKYMKDARGKKPEEKLPLLRKATKIHKELPDEDKK